jgi:hypothetical protein
MMPDPRETRTDLHETNTELRAASADPRSTTPHPRSPKPDPRAMNPERRSINPHPHSTDPERHSFKSGPLFARPVHKIEDKESAIAAVESPCCDSGNEASRSRRVLAMSLRPTRLQVVGCCLLSFSSCTHDDGLSRPNTGKRKAEERLNWWLQQPESHGGVHRSAGLERMCHRNLCHLRQRLEQVENLAPVPARFQSNGGYPPRRSRN